MTTTPSPRPRGGRRAGSWLAAGLGAAAVAAAVAAGRRVAPRRSRGAVAGGPPPTRLPPPTEPPARRRAGAGLSPAGSIPAGGASGGPVRRSGTGANRLGPESVPGLSGPSGPSDEQLSAGAAERGSVTSERPSLPRRRPGAELPESRPEPDTPPDAPGDGPDAPDLPLGFLSELHDRFRADVEETSGELPVFPAVDGGPASPPAGDPGSSLATGGEMVARVRGAGRRGLGRRRPAPDHANGQAPASTTPADTAAPAPAPSGLADGDAWAAGRTEAAAPAGPGAGAQGLADGDASAAGTTDGDAGTDGGASAGAGVGGGPSRRVLGAVVAAVMVLVFVVGVAVIRSSDDPAGTGPAGDAGASGGDDGLPTTASGPPPAPQQAFAQASEHLVNGGSFAYTGAAHATDVSRARPGLWLAVDVVIAGQVDLESGRVHETAVALGGGATETVVDGGAVWGRTASSAEALADEEFRVIPELSGEPPMPMGAALLPVWLGFATNLQQTEPDALGRPTYRATLPAAALGQVGDSLVDAEIALTLGAGGEPASVGVTALPAGAALQVVVDLADVGDPVTIDAPGPSG